MFGTNQITGQGFFKDAPKDSLFVTAEFLTQQGEGPFRGEPAFFIRLTKCNLACSFCDAFFDDGDWMTFDEIDQSITKTITDYYEKKGLQVPEFAQNREMVLVITGGEPMLQANIGKFLETVGSTFKYTQIESNGTLLQEIPDSTVLVVSPKCSEKSGNPTKYLQTKQEVLDRADCLKFVMSADQESPYSSIPDWAHDWAIKNKNKKIFISPMNMYNDFPERCKRLLENKETKDLETRSTIDEVIDFWEPGLINMPIAERNHKYAANYCVTHGFTFNMQMHIFAGLA